MITLKEILVKDNNVRQQMLDAFGIGPDHRSIYNIPHTAYDRNPGGISFHIPYNVYISWLYELENIQKGKFPGVSFESRMHGSKLHFRPNFNINDLNRPTSSIGQYTLGDMVDDIILRGHD